MSIWASIPGNDPVVFDAEFGDILMREGWFDVATSVTYNRCRIIIADENGRAAITLDEKALTELHRRITIARSCVGGSDHLGGFPI